MEDYKEKYHQAMMSAIELQIARDSYMKRAEAAEKERDELRAKLSMVNNKLTDEQTANHSLLAKVASLHTVIDSAEESERVLREKVAAANKDAAIEVENHRQTLDVLKASESRVRELQAIVDRLPRTADGVPISGETVVWCHMAGGAVVQSTMNASGYCRAVTSPECDAYYSREAALAAAQKGGA